LAKKGKQLFAFDTKELADLDMEFLYDGIPQPTKRATWKQPEFSGIDFEQPEDMTQDLLKILSSWNVCSKEWIIRQYDHEVQGGSVLKPLQGVANDGPGDGCIIRPRPGSKTGLVVSNGINFRYGNIDPYWMAASCIDEALRQIVSCGGDLDRVAILDNFCWGNPDKPEQLGGLVRAAYGCYDAAKAFGTPFISGKDSLNNEYKAGDESLSIPPTLLISAMGVVEDCEKAVSMDAKKPGNEVYVVGITNHEMGGSHYMMVKGRYGKDVPRVDLKKAKEVMQRLAGANKKGLVRAIHDCSEGGIAVAAAEMAFSGGLGMRLSLKAVPAAKNVSRDDVLLFSESNTRFIVEVPSDRSPDFDKTMAGVPCARIGAVTGDGRFVVEGREGKAVVDTSINKLKDAWQEPFKTW